MLVFLFLQVVTGKVFLILNEIEMGPCTVFFLPLLIGLYGPSFSG